MYVVLNIPPQKKYIYIYTYTCIYLSIYDYIYIHPEKGHLFIGWAGKTSGFTTTEPLS